MNQPTYTMKDFLDAVEALFHSNDSEIKNKSNKFICEFDKRPEAWNIAMEILSTNQLKEEAYYNAIQLLKAKIKYDFGNALDKKELVMNTLIFLIDNIDKFKTSMHYIISNFCQVFAMTMVFSGDNFKQAMKLCVDKLNDQKSIENLLSLLMIFNFLAEANANEQIVIDETNKAIFSNNLKEIEGDVMAYLNFVVKSIITNQNAFPNVKNIEQYKKLFSDNVLEAFTNWTKFDLEGKALTRLDTDFIDVLNFIFTIEQNNMQKHGECIGMLLQLPLESPEMQNLAKLVFSKILPYKDILYQTSIDSLDIEETGFFIDVFCTLAQNNLDQIFTEKRFDLIKIIVDLTKQSDPIKINNIIDFWIMFMQYVFNKRIKTEEILVIFKPMFIELVMNMMKLMQFDKTIFGELNVKKTKEFRNSDEYNAVKDFRDSLKEFFIDFARDYTFEFIYGEILFPQITKTVEEIKTKPNELQCWSRLEVLLYTFNCTAREINADGDLAFLHTLFDTIFQVPKEFAQITRTVTDILDTINSLLSKK